MKVAIKTLKPLSAIPQIFSVTEPAQNWETWHKRFGHTSYHRLQLVLDKTLSTALMLIHKPKKKKPDFIACTESKQIVKPFGEPTKKKTEPGELTHINLWGKYSVKSINGNNYYIIH